MAVFRYTISTEIYNSCYVYYKFFSIGSVYIGMWPIYMLIISYHIIYMLIMLKKLD